MDEVALMLSSSGACYAILNTILMLGTMESFYASVQFLKFSTKLYCTDFVLNPRRLFWDGESTFVSLALAISEKRAWLLLFCPGFIFLLCYE